MRIGRLEIRWLAPSAPPYVVNIGEDRDLSGALAIPDTNEIWRAVHQTINEAERETIDASRRYVREPNLCIAEVGGGTGISYVRAKLIEKRTNAIESAKKLRQMGG